MKRASSNERRDRRTNWRHFAPALLAVSFGFACFVAGGCSFPTVDFETSTTGSSCTVGNPCAKDAQRCGTAVRNDRDDCEAGCGNNVACKTACAETADGGFQSCLVDCQSCAAGQGCTDAAKTCETLVGVDATTTQ